MRPTGCCLLTFVLLVLAPVGLSAQATIQKILDGAGITGADRLAIEAVFSRADGLGIPDALLVPRVEEGIAKGVAARRIAAVLDQDVDRLSDSRELLLSVDGGESLVSSQSAWHRAAHMLSWGATDEEMRGFAAACISRPEAFQPTTFLFVTLVDWGLDRAAALQVSAAAAGSRLNAEVIPEIVDLYVRARRMLIPPARLTNRIIAALPAVRTMRQLEERTLYE
jgi:hypothetical protein